MNTVQRIRGEEHITKNMGGRKLHKKHEGEEHCTKNKREKNTVQKKKRVKKTARRGVPSLALFAKHYCTDKCKNLLRTETTQISLQKDNIKMAL